MDWINALPGSDSVNTNRSNNKREAVFYAVPAATVAMRWTDKKHIPAKIAQQ
jgi:hypothetical protein